MTAIQVRDRTRHGSGREKSVRRGEQLPIRDTSPVGLSRQISVKETPSIVVESTPTADESRESAVIDLSQDAQFHATQEGNDTSIDDNVPGAAGKLGRDSKKKRRKLPQVTEEKRRSSSNINQLLKGAILPSKTKKEKKKGKALSFHSDQMDQPNASVKKRRNSDASHIPEMAEFEMSNLQGIASNSNSGENVSLANHPEAVPSYRPNGANAADRHIDAHTCLQSEEDGGLLHSPNPNTANNNSNYAKDFQARRRSSVDIITQSVRGGGILGSNVHVYSDASSSSPDVSSLEDSFEFLELVSPSERTKADEVCEEVLDPCTK